MEIYDKRENLRKAAEGYEWEKWINEIPYIELPKGYKFAPMPPFNGAVARFLVARPDGYRISVYLDCYDELGFFGKPYWEVYPYQDDVGRCEMNDTEELVRMITESPQ